ncbi:MAG: hypothetical protein AAF414_16180 [Pseudomonadota bacterium]
MRFWFVRVLLNLGILVASGLVGWAGFETTQNPVSFAFGLGLYFFLTWGLAQHATRGPDQVSMRQYIRPLFLTYFLLGLVGMVFMLAGQAAAAINPEAPDMAAGFSAILTFSSLLPVLGGGVGVALVLLIPPFVAIVDRPPPGAEDREQLDEALLLSDQQNGTTAQVPAISAGTTTEGMPMPSAGSPVPAAFPMPQPAEDEGTTLEELFGLDPAQRA